ncbi:HAD family hydrolase [Deinococcus deserti]|uniref:Putative hydrolase n=1 Tax=Deinococcus deserti (strain DSM 17065 / CIP 109153 / LMG 22923 / VCD115) TaxID=546414 RepID=C1D3N1_DEIDV|nr:HAD family hydrolase [Deinococcus deserti]ACO48110.1 putative hydrolase [Deinococcus deserti VCD115]
MLFAFDLDGTIVTKGNVLPPAIRDAILALRQEGHQVTILTGRHRTGARMALDALGVVCHYGTCNGARVHGHGDEHHVELHLEPETVSYLLERFTHDSKAEFYLSGRERMFVRDPDTDQWAQARVEGRDLRPAGDYDGEPAHKFILISEHAGQVQDELAERFPENAYYLWEGRYLEVMAPGGHKGNALARIAHEYGIHRSETVAFGDGPNDLEMLRWAGRSIGVGQLAAGVSDVIDEHVSGPDELGVARWLTQEILGRSGKRQDHGIRPSMPLNAGNCS